MKTNFQSVIDDAKFGATADEIRNIDAVVEYMMISYTPGQASAAAVKHLCAPDNTFIAPTTFPTEHTLEAYADAHAKLMQSVSDLHFVSFDSLFVHGEHVCLRYTAEGTHDGAAWGNIPATHKSAQWTAAAVFRVRDGKITEFVKDWNKLAMWEQLGWPTEECLTETFTAKVKQVGSMIATLGGTIRH